MAAIKFKNALGVERSCEEGFGGIDRTSHQRSGDTCFLLENLDIQADGSLKTRQGYKQVLGFSGEVRGSFNSAHKLYTVIGSSFVLTDTSLGTSRVLGTLPSETGEADIFCYGGNIYVHDGDLLYRCDGTSLVEAAGYTPLYGVGWNPETRGDIYEDINIISDKIRITYSLSGSTTTFNLGVNVASVDSVEMSGKTYTAEALGITIDADDNSVLVSENIISTLLVTFNLTLSPEASQKYRLQKSSKAFVFGNNGGERVCIYNPGISGYLLCSRPIAKSYLTDLSDSADGPLPLYIPASSSVCIGSGGSPITGMAQHFGRALLFTDTDAWCVDWDGEELNSSVSFPKIFMLNSAIGSELIKGSAYFENDPITYFCGRLWRWHSQSGVRDECSASLISDEVTDILPGDSDSVSMLSLPQKHKILIADAEDSEGKLLVYDTSRKTWTLYRGIFAERLLKWGDHPAFSRGGSIYVFSDDLTEDAEDDESFPISSRLVSHFTDFGCPQRVKRSLHLILSCDLSGGEASVTFENELGEKRALTLKGKGCGGSEQFSERTALPRFKKLRYSIESQSPITLYGAILSAK